MRRDEEKSNQLLQIVCQVKVSICKLAPSPEKKGKEKGERVRRKGEKEPRYNGGKGVFQRSARFLRKVEAQRRGGAEDRR